MTASNRIRALAIVFGLFAAAIASVIVLGVGRSVSASLTTTSSIGTALRGQ